MTALADVLAAHSWLASQSACQCGWGYGDMSDDLNHIAHQVEAVAAAGLQVIPVPDVDKVAEAIRETTLHGCISQHDPRYYRCMAAAAVEAVTA